MSISGDATAGKDSSLVEDQRDPKNLQIQIPFFFSEQIKGSDNPITTTTKQNLRRLQDNSNQACDSAFLDCLKADSCVNCFVELETKNIDWASVSEDTPCSDVTKFLFNKDHCKYMETDTAGRDTFCKTYDACVDWDEEDGANGKNADSGPDCSTLTACKWDGMHEQFLGDGICHDRVGCYNTEGETN